MVVATGGMFMVPRGELRGTCKRRYSVIYSIGNLYTIENICDRDARLFFTQAKMLEMNGDETASKEAQAAEAQKKRLSGRWSSVGAMPNGRAASLAALPSSQ